MGKQCNPLGLAAFFIFTFAGATSTPVYNALSVLDDLLPLRSDIATLLGFPADGTPDVNWSYALPGLVALAIILAAACSSSNVKNAALASADLLEFPNDFRAAIAPCG